MTRDKTLENLEAILHGMRRGQVPYFPPEDIAAMLRDLDALRDEGGRR
jgi:hypothetical protein